ncbi:nucleolar MIF4G domain-containing protein 1 homolog [Rhopalosiphum maidis]|uniref:nucleolar MIF4G domain-containing protein 1 homolog n=1 Tax=Rhopalosiphum maidis TaxID=43146 RepID=UPI000EFE4E4A|nr:nucleolar MIF4G domain-containing protein 1 homolog [Rhopalosiphum maidis]
MKTKSSVKTTSEQRFVFKSRKAERKAMRQMKKQKKGHLQQVITNEVNVQKVNAKKKLPKTPNTDWRVLDRNKEKVEEIKLQKQFEKTRREQMKHANEDEDKEIKRLAKHLKLDKRKTVGKSFIDDGLDYLLDVCDPETRKNCSSLKESLLDIDSNFDDDYNTVNDLKKKKENKQPEIKSKKKVTFEFPDNLSDENVSDEDILDDELEDESISGEETLDEECDDESMSYKEEFDSDKSDTFDYDHEEEFDYNDEKEETFSGSEPDDEDSLDNNDDTKSISMKEDIYGRIRKPDGTIVEQSIAYVPPHLRKKQSEESEQLKRLRQQVKGLLNRLAETNMHNISRQIEDLYQVNSRNNMNETIYKCIADAIINSECVSPYRIIVESSTLITVLHTNVGSEIGAFFLQNLATRLNTLIESNNIKVEDKELDNIVLLLCCLYAFKVFHSGFIFEILNKLLIKFEEKHIDLILSILKTIGFNLRKDSPTLIKQLLLDIQKKSSDTCESTTSSRVKFMLEILSAIKNNNVNKIPTSSEQCYSTYIEHIQKVIRTYYKYNKTPAELTISYEDLLNADNKGRWWIVGSAWKGDEPKNTNNPQKKDMYDKKLLDMAKKYRMNTDTRKNIFCILFTAEDYLDAFNKLVRLGLKGLQQEEIVSVLIHCLLVYKMYNPFFAYVAQQLCQSNRKYQAFFKKSINVRLEEIDNLKKNQIPILASFLAQMLRNHSLPITILKNVDWGSLNKLTVSFVRQTLIKVLQDIDEEETTNIFLKASKNPTLQFFREGLTLFLSHFLIKNASKDISDSKLELLTNRVKVAQAALNRC